MWSHFCTLVALGPRQVTAPTGARLIFNLGNGDGAACAWGVGVTWVTLWVRVVTCDHWHTADSRKEQV